MAIRLKAYSDYTNSIGALCGITVKASLGAQLSTQVAENWRVNFQTAMQKVWTWFSWLDVCPNGEARFVGNKIGYSNDLSQTSEWTATALTITGNVIANPLDGRVTASKLLETSATSAHSVAHSAIAIVPSTTYIYSAYVRPIGRNYVYLNINDGDLAHNCFFNVQTGVLGTATNCTANIQNVGSGFWLCSIQFTTSTSVTATTSSVTIQASTDGSTLSYAGDTAKGLYVWGALLQQTTNTNINDSLVAYDQTGEEVIEATFQVWQDSPYNTTYPRAIGYELTPNGIQVIGTNTISYATVNSAGVTITTPQSNPVFIYYRKQTPKYEGDTFDTTATYAVDDQVYFTDSDSVSNYWKCTSATSAGESPESTPTKWSVRQIPESMFYTAVWWAYSDWLSSDGQAEKADAANANAQRKLDDAVERETRQQGQDFPIKISTHVTSQPRAASY